MEKSEFAKVIRMAVAGDRDAVEMFIICFMPMLNSRSVIHHKVDIDLRQYFILCVIEGLPKSHIK